MNLLYVSDSPTVSGAEKVLFDHLDAFAPPDYTRHVVVASNNRRLQQDLAARGITAITARFSPTPVRTTADPAALSGIFAALFRVSRQLRALIQEHRIDLVHTVMYPASLYVALACRGTRCRQLWHEHNVKRLHGVNRPIYRWIARSCTRVIGPSDAVIAALADSGMDRARLHTVYNGIDLARFSPDNEAARRARRDLGLGPDQPAVGLFGQMLPYKGHLTLIEAAPALIAAMPSIRFFFVGALENPPYQEQLRARLRELGLEERFTFTGWRTDVPALIRAMDVNVVATLTPEPAALSLMETMAMARPIVATGTGGTREIVVDGVTGLIVPPGDAEALAAAVTRILQSPELGASLGEAGRRRVEQRFTRARHIEEIRGLYEAARVH